MSVDRTSPVSDPLSRLAAHVRLPLFRNGYALLFGGVATSGLGLLYWALAARLYPAATVGVNSALLSAMLLLSGLAQLSLNNVLVRFLPVAGARTRRLLIYSYMASAVAAVLFTLIFLWGLDRWAPALSFINQNPVWQGAFILAIVAWGIFSLQDSVLTGLRQTMWVPIENTIFALLKIILLVIFATAIAQGGIFLSWTIPVVLSLPPVNGFIFWWLHHKKTAAVLEGAVAPAAGQLLRYAGGNYLGTLFFLIYTNLLPLIVANNAGVEAAAYFYLPWTIASGMQLIAIHMSTSMTVEASLNPSELRSFSRRALNHSLRLLLPLVAIIFIGAPWFLTVFGKTYSAEGAALLRWLSLAAIPNVVVVVSLGLARVQNRAGLIAVIQAALCVMALTLTYVLLPMFGITGAGMAWMLSQTVGALLVGVWLLKPQLWSSAAKDLTDSQSTRLERI